MDLHKRDSKVKASQGGSITQKEKLQLAYRILLDRELTPVARIVGIYITNRLNEKRGYAWPPQETIAGGLGVDERSVRRAIEQLQSHFAIDRSRRQHEYRPRTTPDKLSAIDNINTGH